IASLALLLPSPLPTLCSPGGSRPMAVEAIPGKVGTGFPSGIASKLRVRAAARLFALAASAAIVIAALPASAQTNDPNLTQEDLDCLRSQAAGGPECVPGRADGEPARKEEAANPEGFAVQGEPPRPTPRPDIDAADDAAPATSPPIADDRADADPDAVPNAVLLPGLIVDLFPNPPPRPPSGESATSAEAAEAADPAGSPPDLTQADPPAPPPA